MSEADLRALDGEARSRAKREFARPLVLAAGAGTGKTTTLVARVVAWCLRDGWERASAALGDGGRAAPDADAIAARVVSRVVAITFTEAAAAEMAKRIGRSLAALAKGELPEGFDARAARIEPLPPVEALPPDPAVRAARAHALLGVLDQLAVRTIHAFCRRVLAAHPLEAGLHPQLEIDADGGLVADEVRAVVERELSRAYRTEDPDPHWMFLAGRGFGPAEIADAAEMLASAGVPAAALEQPHYGPEGLARLRAALDAALRGFFAAGGAALARAPRRERSVAAVAALGRVREIVERLPAAGAAEAWQDVPEALRRAGLGDAAASVAKWADGDFTREGERALGDCRADVVAASAQLQPLLARLDDFDPALFEHGRALLGPLLVILETRLRARGLLSFDALLRRTRALLEERPEIAARLRRSIDQLLVDELQDTDPVQCEILRILALEGPLAERPALFLVGDPKQSIYGWRNADLAAYDAFVRRLLAGDGSPDARGERLLLARNFRSAPPLLEAAQALLEPLFVEQEGVQPPFERLVASEETQTLEPIADERLAAVERWISCDVDPDGPAAIETTAQRASEIEAEALARDLTHLHAQHGVAWRECAVLLRALSDVDVYLEALRRAGVPYEVAKDRSYYRRREVIEAAALVRCILDPNDILALVTWLRSASVGVPDAAWAPLFAGGLPERAAALAGPDDAALGEIGALLASTAHELGGSVPGLDRLPGWDRSAASALRAIAALRASHEREAADVFVERLRRLSGLELTESARPLGLFRAANLERFFAELSDELASHGSPSSLLRRLRRDVAEGREAEAGAPHESAADAVQVLSVHAAKGLDFASVHCVQLHKGSRDARGELRPAEVVSTREGLALKLFGAAGPGWNEACERRRLRAEAERARLLYVALTRAKRRLVLAGLPAALAVRQNNGSALELLASGAAEVRADAERAHGLLERGIRHEDVSGIRCLLAVMIAAEPRKHARDGSETQPEGIGAAEVAAESRRLANARDAARARAARPRTAPASREGHEAARERFDASGADVPSAAGEETARTRAQVRGTLVHRALEHFDFTADPEAELVRLRPLLRASAEAAGAVGADDDALAVLRAFVTGSLYPRARAQAARIVARELPIWVGASLVPTAAGDAPVDAYAGTIDLLYRDTGGDYVVADWKTDVVADEAELRERAARYAAQGRVYVHAVKAALGLEALPRFELWFLHAGQVWDASGETATRLD